MTAVPHLAVVGVGTMAETIVGLAIQDGWPRDHFILTHRRQERRAELEQKLGGPIGADNLAAVSLADAVLVSVRPQEFAGVLDELRPGMRAGQLFISIAAALDIGWLEDHLPDETAIVRAVPPPTSWVRAGYTLLSANARVTEAQRRAAERLFITTCAEVMWLPDSLVDAATSVGMGITPYTCLLVEAIVDSGIELGLPDDLARNLARVGIEATGTMIKRSGFSPGEILNLIATREGLTWAALHTMERKGFRDAVRAGVRAQLGRATELRGERVSADLSGFER